MGRLVRLAIASAALAAARVDHVSVAAAQQPATGDTPAAALGGGAVQRDGRVPVPSQVRRDLAILRFLRLGDGVPPADSFMVGSRTVGSGETVRRSIAVARGSLEVRGHVEGNALALHGDVIVHEGGVVRGDAIAIDGQVRARGGIIGGQIRSTNPPFGLSHGASRSDTARRGDVWHAIKVVLGWLAVLLVIGMGVAVFAESTFDPVVESLHHRFGRAFGYGILAQLAAIPALVVILLALALTVVGLLLIPFAIVAYAVALAGLLTLGFLAVARLTGAAITGRVRDAAGTPIRGANLRALVVGLAIHLSLWVAAALFSWSPLIGSVLRAAALAVTWVAVTLGLGAIVASRVALRRAHAAAPSSPAADPMIWQTPTPVTGVAAARRPASATRSAG